MLKIENHEFKIKSTELNFKQRNYKGESIVTVPEFCSNTIF